MSRHKNKPKRKWIYSTPASPYWQFEFRYRGNRSYGSTELVDEDEAQAYVIALREETIRRYKDALAKTGQSGRLRNICWIDALEDYCDEVLYKNWSKNSATQAERRYDWLSEWIGDKTSVLAIDDAMIKRLVKALQTKRAYDDPTKDIIGPRTVNTYLHQVQAVLNHVRGELKIPLPDEPSWSRHFEETDSRTRVVTAEELVKIEDAADEDLWNCIEFSLESAIRKTAAVTLTWRQVDWEANVIRIVNKGKKPRARSGKRRSKKADLNGKKVVEINITERIAEILSQQWGKHPEAVFTYVARRTFYQAKIDRHLVEGQRIPMSMSNYTRLYRQLCDSLGIEDLTIHDLRRSKGSFIYRRTGGLGFARDALKHASSRTTEKAYAFMTSLETGAAMEKATAYTDEMRGRYRARTGRGPGKRRPGILPEFAIAKPISVDDITTYMATSTYTPSRITSSWSGAEWHHTLPTKMLNFQQINLLPHRERPPLIGSNETVEQHTTTRIGRQNPGNFPESHSATSTSFQLENETSTAYENSEINIAQTKGTRKGSNNLIESRSNEDLSAFGRINNTYEGNALNICPNNAVTSTNKSVSVTAPWGLPPTTAQHEEFLARCRVFDRFEIKKHCRDQGLDAKYSFPRTSSSVSRHFYPRYIY
jgi:integrase